MSMPSLIVEQLELSVFVNLICALQTRAKGTPTP